MADIQKNGNRIFWANRAVVREPAKDKRFRPRVIEAYRSGREYYLGQAVYHNLSDFKCPVAYVDMAMQRAFESGFGLEISDCVQVVRGKAHG